jgi:hypothetical protein
MYVVRWAIVNAALPWISGFIPRPAGQVRVALYGDSGDSNVDTSAVRRLRKKAHFFSKVISAGT